MDPTLAGLLNNIAAQIATAAQANANDADLRRARQADAAAVIMQGMGVDHRVVTQSLLSQLAGATVPTQTGDLNTASHIPGPQPWNIPPLGPQPTPAKTTP